MAVIRELVCPYCKSKSFLLREAGGQALAKCCQCRRSMYLKPSIRLQFDLDIDPMKEVTAND